MTGLHAFLFGVSLAIAIGPIALLIIHNGLNHGVSLAVRSGFGAATADLLYSLVAFLVGVRVVATLNAYEREIHLVSGLALIGVGVWLGANTLLLARRTGATEARADRGGAGFWATLLLTLANPLTLAIFLGFAGQLSLGRDNSTVVFLSFCVFLGSLAVQLTFAVLGASLGKWITDRRAIGVLNFVSALAIIAFGLRGVLS
jgi:threonine/homoserine/homoserine lactone efflux protein